MHGLFAASFLWSAGARESALTLGHSFAPNTESLALFNTGLEGDVPSTISNLQSLEVFKAENCNLSGEGWRALLEIPTLLVLGVAGNTLLTGTLEGIGTLVGLQELYLGETQIGGPLPEELGTLVDLKTIKSPQTAFTGPLPASLGNLKSLRELDFGMNQLDGALPPELGGMVEVEEVFLYGNSE